MKKRIYYQINEEKRTVAAYMTQCRFDAFKRIMLHYERWGVSQYRISRQEIAPLIMQNAYRAKAKCAPDDVFDEKKGKEIARERLLQKYNTALNRAITRFIDHQKKLLT
jgi:hypothetical protein